MSGKKILDGLKDAVAGNFAAVTIEGQHWVRREWQPIETAPKDDTRIDVCNQYGDRTTDVRWRDGAWRHWWLGGFDGMEWVKLSIPPTHWMPVPVPPADLGKQAP